MEERQTNDTTVLSAGRVILRLLKASPEVMAMTSRIFPVQSKTEEVAPYIVYRRSGLTATQVNIGHPADTAVIEMWCYAETYTQGVEMAEAVRRALDGFSGMVDGVRVRRIWLDDAEEDAVSTSGVQLQMLTFVVKI